MTFETTGGLTREESLYIQSRKKKLLDERMASWNLFFNRWTDGLKKKYKEKKLDKKYIIKIERQVWKQVWIERILKRKMSINEYDRIITTAFTKDIARLFQ